jgi:hypothetical protein
MGSHYPFEYLKHNLWPKEGSGIKVPIWLLTTKSQESPWFIYVQVACHIPLEISWWGLNFFFDLTSIGGLQKKLWASKVAGVLILEISKNNIWVQALWLGIENTIRGKVMASPKSRLWWVLWVCVYSWFVHAPKCSNYALTNLFGLNRSMWIIDPLVTHPSPHLEAPARPST